MLLSHDGILDALWPGLVAGGAILALLPWLKRSHNPTRMALIAVVIAAMLQYIVWRFRETLPPFGLTADWLVGILFAGTEAAALFGSMISIAAMSRTTNRTPEVDAQRSACARPTTRWSRASTRRLASRGRHHPPHLRKLRGRAIAAGALSLLVGLDANSLPLTARITWSDGCRKNARRHLRSGCRSSRTGICGSTSATKSSKPERFLPGEHGRRHVSWAALGRLGRAGLWLRGSAVRRAALVLKTAGFDPRRAIERGL